LLVACVAVWFGQARAEGLPRNAWEGARRGVLSQSQFDSLAVAPDGTLWAWGSNSNGQVGDGTTTPRLTPVRVPGLTDVVAAVAGTGNFSLAVREDGTVWAWGANTQGQLGNGTTTQRLTPGQVPGLTDVVSVAAGQGFSLALRGDGTVWAWGANASGELGDGTTTRRLTPVRVTGLSDVVTLAASHNHAVALRGDGTVWAWGLNSSGQLGDGTTTRRLTPVRVTGLTDVVGVSAGTGTFSLAVRGDGSMWAWGSNFRGQLGDGTTTQRLTPVRVPGLTDVVAVSAGHFNFSLALRRDGTVWAWGANEHGQLGDETPFPRRSPAPVMGVTHAVAVAAGRVGSLVLRKDGTLWAWGTDLNGTLGTGTSIVGPRPPSPVLGLSSTAAISAGASHSLALRGDGTVWSWGDNSNGQLSVGNGSLMDRYAPVRVVGVTDIQALFSGPTANHTLALRGDGTVWAWGENMFGQLGDGEWGYINVPPARVAGLTDVKRLAAGQFNSLALRGDGTVWTWGYNMVGFFPNDPMNQFHTPVQVQGLGDVVDVATSGRHALAVREDGTVWAWGLNASGQLGDGTRLGKPTPVQVSGMTGVVAVSAGEDHSLALREDGTVWAWGGNSFGELGNGNVGGLNPTPGQVSGLTDVVSIVAGQFFSVAIRRDGTVWTWGTRRSAANEVLELQRTPVRLEGMTDVVAVALGRFHGLALRADGTTVGWGSNSEGQLANGESPQHLTPARVLLPCRFTGMPSRGHRASEQEHCPAAP
jgi:alpha-tubulin suppressor-like RCC1 family protein